MKRKRKFFYIIPIIISYLILFLYFVSVISAQNYSNNYISNEFEGIKEVKKINIQIAENGLVRVDEELSLNETTAKILIPRQTENLLIFDSKNNELGHESIQMKGEQLLKIYLSSPEDKNVKFSYTTQELTRKNASTWTFKFSSISTPRVTIVKIEFPKEANVTSLKTNQTIYFYPPNLKSPLFLYPQDDKVNFEIDYVLGRETLSTLDEATLPIIVVVVVVIIIIIFLYKKRKSKIQQKLIKEVKEVEEIKVVEPSIPSIPSMRTIKSSVLNILDENEKKVIELLYNSKEEEITQAYIYKTLNIPKASLSSIIKRLEQRNLIEKKKYGRVNWIKLKEWIFK